MLQLISIHIPKTAGSSFYHILKEVYGEQLSISYRRKDYKQALQNNISFSDSLRKKTTILHGHLYYHELKELHQNSNAKVICWLRDPVDRVISNYRHFIQRNSLPNVSRPNQHRIKESLLTYAQHKENQNRMSEFLKGIDLEDLFFIGFLEFIEKDLFELSKLLDWPDFNIPKLNTSSAPRIKIPESIRLEIKSLNKEDCELYDRALALAAK